MSLFWIATSVYSTIALFFLAMTSIEGMNRSGGWDAHRILGLSLSSVWPVLILFVFFLDRPNSESATSTPGTHFG